MSKHTVEENILKLVRSEVRNRKGVCGHMQNFMREIVEGVKKTKRNKT